MVVKTKKKVLHLFQLVLLEKSVVQQNKVHYPIT